MRLFVTLPCSDLSGGGCKRGNPEEGIELEQGVPGHTRCWWRGEKGTERKPCTEGDLPPMGCQRADAAAERAGLRGAL